MNEFNSQSNENEQNTVQDNHSTANDNVFAQDNHNQNAAFEQSAAFHRETPYDTASQNGGQGTSSDTANFVNANVTSTSDGTYQPNSTQTSSQASSQPQQAQQTYTQQNTQPQNTMHAGFNPYTGQPYGQPAQNNSPKKEKKEKKSGVILRRFAGTVAFALIFGVVSGGVIYAMNRGTSSQKDENTTKPYVDTSENDANTQKKGSLNESHTGTLQSASAIMAEALKKASLTTNEELTIPQINIIMEPAMVSINCKSETKYNTIFGTQVYPVSSAGSGIIVGENDTELLIVTNNHVIDNADEITITFADNSQSTAYVKGTDSVNDLAIVVVKLSDIPSETMSAIAYAELGDSDDLVVGESVVAIGNALGYGQSVTSGIVSALNRAVTDSNNNTTYLIQTDAAINPGNSGGALVNRKGQVVGINSAKYSNEAIEGMCFAIPVNTALPILEELMTRTTRIAVDDPSKMGYLGIVPQDVTSQMATMFNMPVGVYVSSVSDGMAAEKAGIISGDVITKFDHETVTSKEDLQKLLQYYEAGEKIEIVVQRNVDGKYVEKNLTVTLDARPADTATKDDNTQNRNDKANNDDESIPSWSDIFGFSR
ncbi:MAG: trypsin-like peptidase domain-containing protein [Clostridia bacterium]|nr:trypsin-like peptidase domain-containing protein [Clostridia bacterium]